MRLGRLLKVQDARHDRPDWALIAPLIDIAFGDSSLRSSGDTVVGCRNTSNASKIRSTPRQRGEGIIDALEVAT